MLLVATPQLASGLFRRSVVLVCDHDAEGALGVVLNHPTMEGVDQHLPAWGAVAAAPPNVFVGGPVQPEVAVALAMGRASFTIEVPRFDGAVGLVDVAGEVPGEAVVRVFSGYAGWSPGQLDEEIEEGSWWLVPAEREDLFSPDPKGLWRRVVGRQPGEIAMFTHYPEDAALN